MKTGLTSGRSKEDVAIIRQEFSSSPTLRKVLVEVLEKKMEVSHNKSMSEDGYNSANWAYLQADARGYERAMKEIISYLK